MGILSRIAVALLSAAHWLLLVLAGVFLWLSSLLDDAAERLRQ